MNNSNDLSKLSAISPIDGRYWEKTESLASYFSEYALIRERVKIEILYLIFLSSKKIIRSVPSKEKEELEKIYKNFDLDEALKVKELEKTTRHDVKAVEYYLREILGKLSIKDLSEFIHVGLTSEDLNNVSFRTLLNKANKEVIVPQVEQLVRELSSKSNEYKDIVIMARTHGQNAIPTSFGKEISVFKNRITKQIEKLQDFNFEAKFSGAVGNYNALSFVYPDINWPKTMKEFLTSLGLSQLPSSTQVNGNDDVVEYLQVIQRINLILLGFNQDTWRYISDGWLFQANKKGEVGSSTMPQKINPIDFENSEGNIAMANGIIDVFIQKMPISRLQRDLSNSTISRNIGTIFAHSLIAYSSTIVGLSRISPNLEKINEVLNSDWSVLSEAAQTLLRSEGIQHPYRILSDLTKGKVVDQKVWIEIVEVLPLSKTGKEKLFKLTPEKYKGIS